MSATATTVSTVWLEVLRAQRPMRYAEIAAALPELSHRHRATSLHVGVRLGYFERDGRKRDYTYRVSARCTVPPGVPIHEVLEATS